MKTLTKIAALTAAAFVGFSAASAQGYGQQPNGYGHAQPQPQWDVQYQGPQQPQYPSQPQPHYPVNQPGPYGPSQPYGQQNAYTGVAGVSPQIAALFTNASYREIQGEMMAVAVYAPDGRCEVTVGGRTRGRAVTSQSCRYAVREIGPGRISMSFQVVINGQTLEDSTIIRIRRDGSLFDEKERSVAVRIG